MFNFDFQHAYTLANWADISAFSNINVNISNFDGILMFYYGVITCALGSLVIPFLQKVFIGLSYKHICFFHNIDFLLLINEDKLKGLFGSFINN